MFGHRFDASFVFIKPDPLLYKSLFTKLMLEKGFLATTAFYASTAHNNEIVENYLNEALDVFNEIAKMNSEEEILARLEGSVCHSGFQRLN